MEKTFDEVYDKIVEELRGNLTDEEYKELINLEYVLTWRYSNKYDEERYQELRDKKDGRQTSKI